MDKYNAGLNKSVWGEVEVRLDLLRLTLVQLPNELWFQIFRWKQIFEARDRKRAKAKRRTWNKFRDRLSAKLFNWRHGCIGNDCECHYSEDIEKVEIIRFGRTYGKYMHTIILRDGIVSQQLFSKTYNLNIDPKLIQFTPVLHLYINQLSY